MAFGRGLHRDDRRRRVLTDTVLGTALRAGNRHVTWRQEVRVGRSAHYGDAEFLERQARLTDLIPTRRTTLVLWAAVGAGLAAGLIWLYAWLPKLAPSLDASRLAPFNLAQRGTVATWLASMSLAMAAAMAVLVYTVRRHKRDDYHGYYRVWLWAAMVWMLLSLDMTSGLHEGIAAAMTALSGTRLWGDGSAWWLVFYGFLVGGVGTRLAFDMRYCRGSLAALALSGGCLLVALTARFGGIAAEDPARQVVLRKGLQLAGSLLLLGSMALHARHVLLDALGLLPRRRTRASVDPGAESWEEPATEPVYHGEQVGSLDVPEAPRPVSGRADAVAIDPPHGVPRPSAAFSALIAPEQASRSAASMPLAPVQRKLTKQEKKALRARLERMREERLRRQTG
jgi:hypothetical protein